MAATIKCPTCGKTNPVELETCQWCHKPMSGTVQGQGTAKKAPLSATMRYADGYVVARAVTGFGTTVKVLSIIAAALIAGVGFFVGASSDAALLGLLGGLAAAVSVGIPLYVLGILLAAVGQILKATLDTAVQTSPLLTTEDMQRAMSIY